MEVNPNSMEVNSPSIEIYVCFHVSRWKLPGSKVTSLEEDESFHGSWWCFRKSFHLLSWKLPPTCLLPWKLCKRMRPNPGGTRSGLIRPRPVPSFPSLIPPRPDPTRFGPHVVPCSHPQAADTKLSRCRRRPTGHVDPI